MQTEAGDKERPQPIKRLWFAEVMKDEGDLFGSEGFLARGHSTGLEGRGEFRVATDPGLEIGEGTFLGFALREVHQG